jgi:hypothetical protein
MIDRKTASGRRRRDVPARILTGTAADELAAPRAPPAAQHPARRPSWSDEPNLAGPLWSRAFRWEAAAMLDAPGVGARSLWFRGDTMRRLACVEGPDVGRQR